MIFPKKKLDEKRAEYEWKKKRAGLL